MELLLSKSDYSSVEADLGSTQGVGLPGGLVGRGYGPISWTISFA